MTLLLHGALHKGASAGIRRDRTEALLPCFKLIYFVSLKQLLIDLRQAARRLLQSEGQALIWKATLEFRKQLVGLDVPSLLFQFG
jgi:hypothetical protein